MSFSTVKSAAMEGLAVEMVYVEADVSNGLPIFHMVGYLSSEVKEAADRIVVELCDEQAKPYAVLEFKEEI